LRLVKIGERYKNRKMLINVISGQKHDYSFELEEVANTNGSRYLLDDFELRVG